MNPAENSPAAAPQQQSTVSIGESLRLIRPRSIWILTLSLAILGALGAFLIDEKFGMRFIPEPTIKIIMGSEQNVPTIPATHRAELKNAMLAYAIFGGGLALALGVAGGLAGRSFRTGVLGGGVGLILGMAAAPAATAALVPIYHRMLSSTPEEESTNITLPLLVHAGIWATIGAAAGVALGIGLGDRSRIVSTALGGLFGGAVGASIYEIAVTLIFLRGTTQSISPDWPVRLIAVLTGSFFVATLAAYGALSARPRRATQKPAEPVPI
jgi:hypothetical protein